MAKPLSRYIDLENISHIHFRFLELTWDYPTDVQSGNYTCEVNGVDKSGHHVMFSTSVDLPVRYPDIKDLVRNYVGNSDQKSILW